jgi:hypothetical protein
MTFFPHSTIHKTDKCCALTGLPVKHAELALPDHSTLAESNHEASTLICSHLLASFGSVKEFHLEEHASVWCTALVELTEHKMVQFDEALASILARMPCDTQRTIHRGKKTGLWLNTLPSMTLY